MRKLIGIIASGSIGRDPYDKRSWSGCSRFFFSACSKAGILERAFGTEAPYYQKVPLMLKNYAIKKNIWREKFYLDTEYYHALTNAIKKKIRYSDYLCDFIQIGAIYNVPSILQGRAKCYSYHDGILLQKIKSPYFPKAIPDKVIYAALDYEECVYQAMNKIFTMSEYLRKSFIHDLKIPPAKVAHIGGGINFDIPPPRNLKKRYDQKNILFVGLNFLRKGGFLLLKAFSVIRDVYPGASLTIIGHSQLNVDERLTRGVRLLGFLDRSDPYQNQIYEKAFDNASILVMPSIYEPFGFAPLEAMVHEIPCILTNRWAFPEFITPGEEGELVECENVDELIEKIIALLKNPDQLAVMGEKARLKVLKNYTWERVANNLAKEMNQTIL